MWNFRLGNWRAFKRFWGAGCLPGLVLAAAEAGMHFFAFSMDLKARWFGFGVGLAFALAAALFFCACSVCRWFYWWGDSSQKPPKIRKLKRFCSFSALTGYVSGAASDTLYVWFLADWELLGKFRKINPNLPVTSWGDAFETAAWCAVPLIAFFVLIPAGVWIYALRGRLRDRDAELSEADGKTFMRKLAWNWGFLVQSAVLAAVVWFTVSLSLPNLFPEKRELTEGIYVYANDTVYEWPILNLWTSRLGGMVHTGICLISRDPKKVNALREKQGLPRLRFYELADGYWLNDLNLEVCDLDGLTNYASRTMLDDQPYPFDLRHWRNWMNGRSPNDRLCPAIRFCRLMPAEGAGKEEFSEGGDAGEIPMFLQKWNEIDAFRREVNARLPSGGVYSPLPYEGKFVYLFNCNSVTVGIADEFLGGGEEAEKMTNRLFHLGREGVEGGRRCLRELRTSDFAERCVREREAFKEALPESLHWIHRLLYRGGQEDEGT